MVTQIQSEEECHSLFDRKEDRNTDTIMVYNASRSAAKSIVKEVYVGRWSIALSGVRCRGEQGAQSGRKKC